MENQPEPTYEDWIKAGQISKQALDYGKSLVKPGNKIVDILDKIEKKIHDLGGIPAFPAQINANEIAAHFCPLDNDETICEDQVFCLDVGACYNGAIGDNATTVDLSNSYKDLVEASQKAVDEVEKILQPGITLSEIGKTIQDVIQSFNYSPIKNLSGHTLAPWRIHAGLNIPNFNNNSNIKLTEGYFAVEPFATDGKGMIHEANNPSVFALKKVKPVRGVWTRKILNDIKSYNNLPFTTRWLTKKYSYAQVKLALRELLQLNILHDYPPLVEDNKGMVSQAEYSFCIKDEKVIKLT